MRVKSLITHVDRDFLNTTPTAQELRPTAGKGHLLRLKHLCANRNSQ